MVVGVKWCFTGVCFPFEFCLFSRIKDVFVCLEETQDASVSDDEGWEGVGRRNESCWKVWQSILKLKGEIVEEARDNKGMAWKIK